MWAFMQEERRSVSVNNCNISWRYYKDKNWDKAAIPMFVSSTVGL